MSRTAPQDHVEVAIIGGGPAGSAAARLLAHWGHSVLIVTKPEPKGATLGESLPPSCRKLFSQLGVLEAVDQAGFYRTRGNTVWWGDAEGRSENFVEGAAGYQVLRRDFDRLLLERAEAAGAQVYRNTTVREADVHRVGRLSYETADHGRGSVTAAFVLDCSGRAGVIARQGFRSSERSHATLALAGVWQCTRGWGLEDETHTLVETYEDGWTWSVPVSPLVRYFTVMVDPRVTGLQRGKRLEAVYQAELNKTRQFKELVARGTLQGTSWGCDASLYSAHRFAASRFLLVGDAASFIDPLSSFGVKKALASGWVAAVVVHTCLTKPGMQELALDYFSTREAQVYASYRKQSARFFEAGRDQYQHPFWTGRASAVDAGPADQDPDIELLRRDPDVLAAFGALKRSASIRLRPSGRLRTEKRPSILDREVILEERLMTPASLAGPAGVRFLRGVDLPRLIQMAGEYRQVPDLFEAYNRACQPVMLPDFLGALSVLLGKGLLKNDAITQL